MLPHNRWSTSRILPQAVTVECGEKGGHYGGLKRATGVVMRWTWQRAQKRNATAARVGHTTWLPYGNLSCPAATAGCVGSALQTMVGNALTAITRS
jgi:hypothetical protein